MEATKKQVWITGRVIREGVEVITLFKVKGKYYPSTDHNNDCMDSYLHTGDEFYLTLLENETELE